MNQNVKLRFFAFVALATFLSLSCHDSPDQTSNSNRPPPVDSKPPEPPKPPAPPPPSKTSLKDATDTGTATVTVRGVNVKSMRVQIQCSTKTEIVIPAGILFSSDAGGTQNMISARMVVVAFAGTTVPETKTVYVEVYCINLFKEAPTKASEFTLSTLDESDPLKALSQCLETKKAKHEVRQLAIWMISEGFLDSSKEEVTNSLRKHYDEEIQKGLDEEGQAMVDKFKQEHPEFREVPNGEILERIRRINATESLTLAKGQVEAFQKQARPLLDACGVVTNGKSFFED